MNILQAFILGIVQGLCEFLPISSSGHLLLFEKALQVEQAGLLMSVLLHVGTLAAVVLVLWQDVKALLLHPLQPKFWMLVVATIPAVLAAVLLNFDAAFQGAFLGISFLITSAMLAFTTWITRYRESLGRAPRQQMDWVDAITMGIMQAIAILPGVSRSGSTLVGGLVRGLDREKAARFAFLMSIPAILGSLVLELVSLAGGAEANVEALPVIVGMLTAAACGIFAIRLMMWVLRQAKLWVFAIYTGALGIFVLLDQAFFHLLF